MQRSDDFWRRVRHEYTVGIKQPDGTTHFPSIRELSRIHCVTDPAIIKKIKLEGWKRDKDAVVKRKPKVNEELAQKISKQIDTVIEHRAGELATEYLDFDIKCVRIAQKAISLINESMHRVEVNQDANEPIHPAILTGYMKALELAQRIGKNAVGEKMLNDQTQITDARKIEFIIQTAEKKAIYTPIGNNDEGE
jgi:hypothetical protein